MFFQIDAQLEAQIVAIKEDMPDVGERLLQGALRS